MNACIASAADGEALVTYAKQVVDLADRRAAFDMLERLKADVFDLSSSGDIPGKIEEEYAHLKHRSEPSIAFVFALGLFRWTCRGGLLRFEQISVAGECLIRQRVLPAHSDEFRRLARLV